MEISPDEPGASGGLESHPPMPSSPQPRPPASPPSPAPAPAPESLPNGPGDPPAGLTRLEYASLARVIATHHTYPVASGQCTSLLSQRTPAPASAVWAIVRQFDRPQVYKHFIRSCHLKDDGGGGGDGGTGVRVGCFREVRVISGLPASTSTERLDVLDDTNRVTGFTIIGGEHRLRNYRSVTTVNEVGGGEREGGQMWTVVLESYVVDVPQGNTVEDTKLFADTVIRLNLQRLAAVAEERERQAEEGTV